MTRFHKNDKKHPFYGEEIVRSQEQEYISHLLKKYRNEPVSEELKAKIWDELQMEKYTGKIKIPFKVVLRHDAHKRYPDCIEIILDTKV